MASTTDGQSGGIPLGDPHEAPEVWPPNFPHLEIDDLLGRLESGKNVNPAEAFRLLALVAGESHRLRATAVRLASARLTEADREAERIVARAADQARDLRELGLVMLNTRLDEGDRLLRTARESLRVQARIADVMAVPVEENPGCSDQPWPGTH